MHFRSLRIAIVLSCGLMPVAQATDIFGTLASNHKGPLFVPWKVSDTTVHRDALESGLKQESLPTVEPKPHRYN
jgi:hypothetical protein